MINAEKFQVFLKYIDVIRQIEVYGDFCILNESCALFRLRENILGEIGTFFLMIEGCEGLYEFIRGSLVTEWLFKKNCLLLISFVIHFWRIEDIVEPLKLEIRNQKPKI